MKINPLFVAISLFLVIGLIWSGGHVAWLIILGVYVIGASLVSAVEHSKNYRR